MTVLAMALCGGLGAMARFVVDSLLRRRFPAEFPVGTMAVNLSGSFALGLLLGLVARGAWPADLALIAGAGFLGGFTTFSTACVELLRLVQDRRYSAAVTHLFLMAGGSIAAAALGLWLAA